MWFDDKPAERIGLDRVQEALETRAAQLAVACPFCLTMLKDGLAARTQETEVRDIAELMLEALE
jgi:Fe-S oxidoreductase